MSLNICTRELKPSRNKDVKKLPTIWDPPYPSLKSVQMLSPFVFLPWLHICPCAAVCEWMEPVGGGDGAGWAL